MMAVMTAQPPLPLAPEGGAVGVGAAAALVEDGEGGRVFLHGQLVYAWAAGDAALRRLAAVQLVAVKAAPVGEVAAAFGVDPATVWRWRQQLEADGVAALVPGRPGPKGAHRLTPEVVAEITARRETGASYQSIAEAVGVSEASVRRAVKRTEPARDEPPAGEPVRDEPASDEPVREVPAGHEPVGDGGAGDGGQLPVLPGPVDRSAERAAARWGLLGHAEPVFGPAARVPLAGLLLALPGLEDSGLLGCAAGVFGRLPNGFYGLSAMLVEGVFRALAGEPRAEGATRIDPVALGRVLGLDRAPEVKTIRRKIAALAGTGKGAELLAAMAAHHAKARPEAVAVLYVDGHVRAYHGTRAVAKTHSARLRFPAPATVETWVCDAAGDPVLVVMAEPGAALTGQLRRLLPDLRSIVGANRRVLVGFDRGGWSPALFKEMTAAGFDVLTWRKGPAGDVDPARFTEVAFHDEQHRAHTWTAADTTVDLPLEDGATLTMRQITRLDTAGRRPGRQVHLLTTRTDLPAGELIHRMGSRWRQENYFRYARLHLDLDSHDSYTASEDDPARSVPNPAKKAAHQRVLTARARLDRARARTDADLLAARSPAPGRPVLLTNTEHDRITADLRAAETALRHAQAAHRELPARLPLAQVNPGQQALDTDTKLITHAIRIAAFNTATALARDLRVHTGYARAHHEAHTLIRHALTGSGDLDPTTPDVLTVALDPMPTPRATAALTQLCEHLTATHTRYPGTDLLLRYQVKPHP